MKENKPILFFWTIIFFFSSFFYFSDDLKYFKYGCVILLFLFILFKNVYFKKRFVFLNIIISCFSFIVLLSGYYSEIELGKYEWHIGITSSILLAFQTITSFGFVEYVILNNLGKTFLKYFTIILGINLIITDIYLISIFNSIVEEPKVYYIGNKFIISYYHILLFALCSTLYELNKFMEILFFVVCIVVSKIVYCTTGIIGSISFYVFYIFRKYIQKFLFNSIFFVGSIVLSGCFFIVVDLLVNMPFVIQILESLGENQSLTGRTVVYEQFIDIIKSRPLLGYGNANNSSYVGYTWGIGNAQNGIIADIVDWGILGTSLFLILAIVVLNKCKNRKYSYFLLCFLYMYIVTGLVEITMGIKFIVALAIFLVASNVIDITQKCLNKKDI